MYAISSETTVNPIAALNDATIRQRLGRALPGWTLEEGRLCRVYRTADWAGALAMVMAIGRLADAADHHPDIRLSWGRVEISLYTHDANGITERDFALAERIEALPRQGADGE